jgi:twitching motility protein PilT
MQLLDDNMFRLWKEGLVEKSDVLLRAVNPEELASKIARVERGLFEDDEDEKGRPDAA